MYKFKNGWMDVLYQIIGDEMNVKHRTTTLGTHCKITNDYLETPTLSPCGIFHTIYGTFWLTGHLLPTPENRKKMSEIIGKRQEQIIFLWAIASGRDRREWIKRFFFGQDREDLLDLELANYKADCADKIANFINRKL